MSGVPPAPTGSGTDDIHEAIRIAQGARTKPRLALAVVVIIAVTVVTVGWFAGWFAPTTPIVTPQTCAGQVELTGAGATDVSPVMRAWSAEYNTSVCAKVLYSGTGSGIADLASKNVDFAVTDAPLNSTQSSALGAGSLALPVALEATVVVYHVPGVLAPLHLSGALLASIFLGDITNWNNSAIQAVNPTIQLPSNLAITPIYCSAGCGTSLVFTGYLSRSNATWNATVGTSISPAWPAGVGVPNGSAVVDAVNTTLGGVGYAALPLAQQAGLPWAGLQNPSGSFVAPSAVNTTAAAAAANPLGISETGTPSNQSLVDEPGSTTYPMATQSYVIVYHDIGIAYNGAVTRNAAQWLGAYILWISTAAQSRGTLLGYAPLPPALLTWNSEVIETLLYYGLSVLSGGDADGGL
ncbi:MAG: phosphate ABC transporter substrate-binding protein PstS [Thermoplasmata archaeon]